MTYSQSINTHREREGGGMRFITKVLMSDKYQVATHTITLTMNDDNEFIFQFTLTYFYNLYFIH